MRMLYKVDENQEEVALKKLGGVALGEVVHLETTLTQSYRPPIVSTLYFSLWTVMLCYIKIVLY